jgi:hypothetical protein
MYTKWTASLSLPSTTNGIVSCPTLLTSLHFSHLGVTISQNSSWKKHKFTPTYVNILLFYSLLLPEVLFIIFHITIICTVQLIVQILKASTAVATVVDNYIRLLQLSKKQTPCSLWTRATKKFKCFYKCSRAPHSYK